ncbi:MAG: SRPBCC family protein [Chloroflexota bacterium]|nr:SRPBCC family protein [Chloroflexota bacterium]
MQEGDSKGVTVEKTVTINRPVGEVYAFWRDFANLPRFMTHLEAVTARANGLSHWVTKAPLGQQVEWDAEIINEMQDKVIAWRSIGETAVPNAGYVHFEPEAAGHGTVVKVALEYAPPAGVGSGTDAKVSHEAPDQQVDEDLRRFKEIMESGEVPSTEGQPAGRLPVGDEARQRRQKSLDKIGDGDTVTEASEESFPASDSPAWSSTPRSGV